jgi:cytoskeletal protein CcmA (bactofilin family)
MVTVGASIRVTGELRTVSDLTILGHIDGLVLAEGCAVFLAAGAHLRGDIVAREILVEGRADGHFVATDVVRISEGAVVSGQIVAARFSIDDGGKFTGRVEPQHLEAALRVARFQQQQRDSAARQR